MKNIYNFIASLLFAIFCPCEAAKAVNRAQSVDELHGMAFRSLGLR